MATGDIKNTPVGSLKIRTGPVSESPKANSKPEIAPAAKATMKKKTLTEKFNETFVKEDFKKVGKDLVTEKIFPELMGLVIDLFSEALTRHFGLNGRGIGGSGYGYRANYTNYSTYAQPSSYGYSYNNQQKQQQVTDQKKTGPNDYRNIRYFTKDDAEAVLRSLKGYAAEYQQSNVTVADLYSFSSLTSPSFTDNNYGWTLEMLDKVKPLMIREDGENKWYLSLPSPVPVD